MENAAMDGGWGAAVLVIWLLVGLIALAAIVFAVSRVRKRRPRDQARQPDDIPTRATPADDGATRTTDPVAPPADLAERQRDEVEQNAERKDGP